MSLLVDGEVELLVENVELLVAHVVGFHLVDPLLQIPLAGQLHEALVLGRAAPHLEEPGPAAILLVAVGFVVVEILLRQGGL